mmetsp:Transcript_25832/g.75707  ORF Transcript_25832/g.75707 Transcript_25832/m.75707 type:complete len:207 (+) Transcript_25832:636-1256(+)
MMATRMTRRVEYPWADEPPAVTEPPRALVELLSCALSLRFSSCSWLSLRAEAVDWLWISLFISVMRAFTPSVSLKSSSATLMLLTAAYEPRDTSPSGMLDPAPSDRAALYLQRSSVCCSSPCGTLAHASDVRGWSPCVVVDWIMNLSLHLPARSLVSVDSAPLTTCGITCTSTCLPGGITPALGRTQYFLGAVVFTLKAVCSVPLL